MHAVRVCPPPFYHLLSNYQSKLIGLHHVCRSVRAVQVLQEAPKYQVYQQRYFASFEKIPFNAAGDACHYQPTCACANEYTLGYHIHQCGC
jgi:hypothetical protein